MCFNMKINGKVGSINSLFIRKIEKTYSKNSALVMIEALLRTFECRKNRSYDVVDDINRDANQSYFGIE